MLSVLSKTVYSHAILILFTMTQALPHKDLHHPGMRDVTLQEISLYVICTRAIRQWPVACWQTGKRGSWGSSLLAACPVGTTVGFQPPSR